MLYEITKVYMDYYEDKEIVSGNPKIKVRGEGIRHVFCKPFKYHVEKHPLLFTAIVKFTDKFVIMPQGIECHPDTTLDDIEEIKLEKQVKQEKKQLWKFNSSSGNGTYTVQKVGDSLICNCPGAIRSKGNCKHLKEVRSWVMESGAI